MIAREVTHPRVLRLGTVAVATFLTTLCLSLKVRYLPYLYQGSHQKSVTNILMVSSLSRRR